MSFECQNNAVAISGIVHRIEKDGNEYFGNLYKKFIVETKRLSGTSDFLPIITAEKDFANLLLIEGDCVKIRGQLCSCNKIIAGRERHKLVLSIASNEITICNQLYIHENIVKLRGFLCRKPVLRITPKGRKISDTLIAVNIVRNKSYYIPLIAWGDNARLCSSLDVGVEIEITGRFQSRKYEKQTEMGESVEKIAYEVSVSRFELAVD